MVHLNMKMLIPYFDGQYMIVEQKKIVSALPYITRRLEYRMPIETIDVDEIRKVVDYIHVNVSRDCTKEEVAQLVGSIKNLLYDAIDNIPHHERYLYKKDEDHSGEDPDPDPSEQADGSTGGGGYHVP